MPSTPPAPYPDANLDFDEGSDGGFNFWELLRIFVKWWWLIAIIVLVVVAATTIFTLRQTPMYRATTTVEIKQQESNIIEVNDVEQINANAEFMSTQYSLLRSRALAERVVQSLNLTTDDRFANQTVELPKRVEQAASVVVDNLSVAPVGRSRLVNISYASSDPRLAARVSDAVAETFIAYNLERKFNATSYARDFLEERIAATKTSLEASERALIQYADEQGIVNINNNASGETDATGSLDSAALVSFNAELATVQAQRIDLEQRYNEAASNQFAADIQNDPTIQSIQTGLAELESEYLEKSNFLKPDFPEMVELNGKIDAAKSRLRSERSNIVNTLESQYQATLSREQGLQSRINEIKGDVISVRNRSIDYTILQRDVDTNRTQYDALLQRLKEISTSDGIGSNLVSIVDRAKVPNLPFEPNLKRSLVMALLLSAAFGFGLAYLIELIDDRIKLPDDIKEKLDLRILGVVPLLGKDEKFEQVLTDSQSSISEAYASTRTSLQFAVSGAPRIIQITSTRPGEGKSSSAFALAKSFAAQEQKTLIIDADLRLPAFSRGGGESIGLTGLLTSMAPIEPQLLPSKFPHLFLLPAGKVPSNPAELLSGHRFEQVLHELRDQFDQIIIDGPPVLGLADAPILGAVCEATILVIEAGAIRTPSVKLTLERLATSNTHLIGAILTKYKSAANGYLDYYQYSYGKEFSEYGKRKHRKPKSVLAHLSFLKKPDTRNRDLEITENF